MNKNLPALKELPEDELLAIEYAITIRDKRFCKNSGYIRQALLLYLANPLLTRPKLKQFAKEHFVKHQTIIKLRKHPAFQRELKAYMRDVIGGDQEIREAYSQLVKAMRRGEPYAVKKLLEDTGVMSHVGHKTVVVETFDELLKKITGGDKPDADSILDADFTEIEEES